MLENNINYILRSHLIVQAIELKWFFNIKSFLIEVLKGFWASRTYKLKALWDYLLIYLQFI